MVRRAGDVIPQIVRVLPGDDRAEPVPAPERCPECNSPVERPADEAVYRCIGGWVCQAQRQGLDAFVSKGAMNVDGVGGKLIETGQSRFGSNDLQIYIDCPESNCSNWTAWARKARTMSCQR